MKSQRRIYSVAVLISCLLTLPVVCFSGNYGFKGLGIEYKVKRFLIEEKNSSLPYSEGSIFNGTRPRIGRKLSISVHLDLQSRNIFERSSSGSKGTSTRDFTAPERIECDDLEPLAHLCPIHADVQIDFHKDEDTTITRYGHVCSTYTSANYDCVMTISENGNKVQGMKRNERGTYFDFVVSSCLSESKFIKSTSKCAYLNDEDAMPKCEDVVPPRRHHLRGGPKLVSKLHGFHSQAKHSSELYDVIVNVLSGNQRELARLDRWEDCYDGVTKLSAYYIGISIGSTLFSNSLLGGDVDTTMKWVEAIVADANVIYTQQLNIKLTVRHVEIVDQPARVKIPWDNDYCTLNVRNQLEQYGAYSRPSEQGVWHYFDDCFKEGDAVGAAYQGVLCTEDFNIGSTNIHSVSKAWLTFAHEIGHNFGASHSFEEGRTTTGGIMDYGGKLFENEYQFNKKYREQEICGEISISRQNCPGFWDEFGDAGVCGNGIIEIGEDCECLLGETECHCCSLCKLKTGAICDPLHNECCQSNCLYKDTRGTCWHSDGEGYCRNGVCTNPTCKAYGGQEFCGVHLENPCKVRCEFEGSCYTMDGWINTATGAPVNHVRSGAYCIDINGNSGDCRDGFCVQT